MRHKESFRYYESGYPFEYYMVRFIYSEKSEFLNKSNPDVKGVRKTHDCASFSKDMGTAVTIGINYPRGA